MCTVCGQVKPSTANLFFCTPHRASHRDRLQKNNGEDAIRLLLMRRKDYGGSSRHGPLRENAGPVRISLASATNRIPCRHCRGREECSKELQLFIGAREVVRWSLTLGRRRVAIFDHMPRRGTTCRHPSTSPPPKSPGLPWLPDLFVSSLSKMCEVRLSLGPARGGVLAGVLSLFLLTMVLVPTRADAIPQIQLCRDFSGEDPLRLLLARRKDWEGLFSPRPPPRKRRASSLQRCMCNEPHSVSTISRSRRKLPRVTTLNRRTRRPQVQPDTLALKSVDFFVITCRGAAPPAGTGPSSSPRPRVHGFLGWRQAVPHFKGRLLVLPRADAIHQISCVLIFLARIPIECCYSKCTLRKPTGFVGRAGTSGGRGVLVHTASSCARSHHHSKKVHELHLAVTGVQLFDCSAAHYLCKKL